MRAGELIGIIDSIKPNTIGEDMKFRWLCDAESRVLCEILKKDAHSVPDRVTGDQHLSVPAPYSRMYTMYLIAMMSFFAGDYDTYVKANYEYEQVFAEYARYHIRTRGK